LCWVSWLAVSPRNPCLSGLRMRDNDQHPGATSDAVRQMATAGLSYLRARAELAGMEGKESVARLGGVLLLAALAVTLAISGLLLLCMSIVFGIATLLGGGNVWIWVALAMGTLLLAGAWVLVRWAKGWLAKPMFAATLEEFRKDDAWLRSTAGKQR